MISTKSDFLLRISILSVFGALLLWGIVETSFAENEVSRESIDSALRASIESGDYIYAEEDMSDPEWLLKLQDWFRKMDEAIGTTSALGMGLVQAIGFIVLIIIVIAMAMIVAQRWSIDSRIRAEKTELENLAGDELLGKWGGNSFEKAQELAKSGKFRDAISYLLMSLLFGLDKSGWIRFRKGGPSRFYLRQLRRSESLYPLFRDFLWKFELAYYREDVTYSDDWDYLKGIYENIAVSSGNSGIVGSN